MRREARRDLRGGRQAPRCRRGSRHARRRGRRRGRAWWGTGGHRRRGRRRLRRGDVQRRPGGGIGHGRHGDRLAAEEELERWPVDSASGMREGRDRPPGARHLEAAPLPSEPVTGHFDNGRGVTASTEHLLATREGAEAHRVVEQVHLTREGGALIDVVVECGAELFGVEEQLRSEVFHKLAEVVVQGHAESVPDSLTLDGRTINFTPDWARCRSVAVRSGSRPVVWRSSPVRCAGPQTR